MQQVRRVTLQDVADRAGVSLTTASRVVNEGSRRVGPQLAQRVNQAVAELGYTANLQARAVATGQSTLVGVVVHDIADPYFSSIAAGLIEVADARRLLVCMSSTAATEAAERDHGAGQCLGAGRVLRQDRVHAQQVLADGHGAAAGAGEGGDLGAQRLAGPGVVGPAADQDHRARPLGAHERDVLAFGRLGGRRARHADQQPAGVGDLDQAGRDGGEVRVRDVVDDHADHRALAGGDRSGLQVGGVSEVGDGLVDPLRQLRPDPARALVHHPGRGGQRHAGQVRDVLQRHPADLLHYSLLA